MFHYIAQLNTLDWVHIGTEIVTGASVLLIGYQRFGGALVSIWHPSHPDCRLWGWLDKLEASIAILALSHPKLGGK